MRAPLAQWLGAVARPLTPGIEPPSPGRCSLRRHRIRAPALPREHFGPAAAPRMTMRAPFLIALPMALPGSPSSGWLGVAPTSSGDLDEAQPIP